MTSSGWPCLVADIGGSNARFALAGGPGQALQHMRVLPVASHASVVDAAASYLCGVQQDSGDAFVAPCRAALAVATAVKGDEVCFTNSAWSFSVEALRQALDLRQLRVLNDFEALALALPHLQSTQYRSWGAAPRAEGCLAVVGAGTGLGVAGVRQTPHGWVAMPGEGGHATLAAANDFESELLRLVRLEYHHVSAERLLSGIGLPVLHQAMLRVQGHDGLLLSAEEVVAQGLVGDLACRQTLMQFCAFLGGFAGNVALTLGARGGLYIGGGIVPRLGDLFFASEFRQRFEAKGRFETYLREIPIALLTDTLAALHGARSALEVM